MVWHVDNKTAPLVKPRKQPVFSKETRYFTDEIGQTPTVPQADWFNMIQGELLQLAKALGVTPDKLNDGQIGPALLEKLKKVTPSTITASTKNSVTDSSHTHEITKATTSQAGIVQLTNTVSSAQDKAITPFAVNELQKSIEQAITEATEVTVDKIFAFDTATPPKGYIARNGQAIDQATMPKLYARYGANMPDDRDRVLRMAGSLAGTAGTTQEDAMQRITGSFEVNPGHGSRNFFIGSPKGCFHRGSTGSGQAPYISYSDASSESQRALFDSNRSGRTA